MSSGSSRLRRAFPAALILLPLLIGVLFLAGGRLDPARTWSAGTVATGAPAAEGILPTELVDARRAAGEAGAQASLLTTGTEIGRAHV